MNDKLQRWMTIVSRESTNKGDWRSPPATRWIWGFNTDIEDINDIIDFIAMVNEIDELFDKGAWICHA